MIEITLNGAARPVDAPPDMPLHWALRDVVGLTGAKFGCGVGFCGACTAHVDGVAERRCLVRMGDVAGKSVTTSRGCTRRATIRRRRRGAN